MIGQRLHLLIESDLFGLPADGQIAVIGVVAGDDLSAMPADRVQVVTGLKPDHDWFAARGFDVATEPDAAYAGAVVRLPRSKSAGWRALRQAAAATRGPIVVDGQKTDGIDAVLRRLRARGEVTAVLSKAHGKIVVVEALEAASDAPIGPQKVNGGWWTAPGVFSADGPDPGSVALAAALPAKLGPRVADLGAGWGYLAHAALAREGVASVDLYEADVLALDCARRNLGDDRAAFHWADIAELGTAGPVDTVICNPPFHRGRRTDTELGLSFVFAAARILKPAGALWLVANRHLPYEATLRARFREVREIDPEGARAYKIFHATHPRKGSAAPP